MPGKAGERGGKKVDRPGIGSPYFPMQVAVSILQVKDEMIADNGRPCYPNFEKGLFYFQM